MKANKGRNSPLRTKLHQPSSAGEPCDGGDHPALDTLPNPDAPAGFPESGKGTQRIGHWARISLGRLGWLVIGTFHTSLLIGADLYPAGPSVESVRHGGADGRHLIPENSRHSRCDDEGSRDDGHGHGVVHPANMRLRGTQT